MKVLIVTYNDSYDYYTRTKYVENYFTEKGYEVQHLISNFNHRKKEKYIVDSKRKNVIYLSVPKYKNNISLQRLYSCYVFSKKVKKYILKTNVDVVYHCAPPNCTIRELSKVRKQKNFFLITEIGDMWPESMPIDTRLKALLRIPLTFWANFRNKFLYNSDCVIAECNLFKRLLDKDSNAKNISTIYFCKSFMGDEQNESILNNRKLAFCYLGSINNIIDIDLIESFFKKISSINGVEFHIIGDGEKCNELISRVKKTGTEVHYYGMVFNDKQKKKIFSQCHYALNIMKKTVCVGMTMKSLDYFSFGIPIINNIGGDIWDMIDKQNVGYNLNNNNIDEVAEKIVSADYDEYRMMRINVKKTHAKYFDVNSFETQLSKALNRGK